MKSIRLTTLALLVLGGLSSCADVSGVPDKTLVVRGKVTTGTHTATAVSGGYVRLIMPQGTGGGHWIGLDFGSQSGVPSKAVTNTDGSYTFTVDVTAIASITTFPIFLAASDSSQTLTMMAELPADLATDGALLSIDINPVSTAASQMICPGGVYPPPANSWCYSDPNAASTQFSSLETILSNALNSNLSALSPGTPPNWTTFSSGFLNDPSTYTEIKQNLTGAGVTFGTATPSTMISSLASLPLVTKPTPADENSLPSGTGTSGSCMLVWNCGNGASCTSLYGSNTGSVAEPDAATCASNCHDLACSCTGC